jgi:transcriptional regulator GlxA family with amidase domain
MRKYLLYESEGTHNLSDIMSPYFRPETDVPSVFTTPPPFLSIQPDMRVGFVLSPCFSLLPFASFIDILRHAADEGDFSRQIYCHWKIIGPSLSPVAASCGVEITPDEIFPDSSEFDYIVVIGGLLPKCLELPQTTLEYLRRAYEANTSIVGLCTGSFILARAGLLDNRRCAIHVDHLDQIKQLFPLCHPEIDQFFVNDNEIITCPGGTAALDLAFSLIEERCGKARAIKGLAALSAEKHQAAHHRPNRLYGFLSVCGNRRVEQAIGIMERHISTPFKIHELAKKLNTSVRELNRAFTQHAGEPPTAIGRKMRLSHGHWLLVNTTKTVAGIASECGFSDGSHFCRWFKRIYAETPIDFRNHRHAV